MRNFIEQLKGMNACADARGWLCSLPKTTTPQQAWDICERGDWMLWLVGRMDRSQPYSDERKLIVGSALECARLAWQWMPGAAQDCTSLHERWVNGKDVPIKALQKARASSSSAASSSAASYAAASYAAASAAYAAYAASSAAAYAAAYAASTAAAAATAAAETKYNTLVKCADLVRKSYPVVPEIQESSYVMEFAP